MDFVLYEGSRLPFYVETDLRRLDRIALREHALTLYRTLGHSKIGMAVPQTYDQVLDWVMRVQGMHLEPLRGFRTPGLRGSRSLGDLADYQMLADGDYRGMRTGKMILGESHSRHAVLLAQRNPMLAAAILREINDGIQRFHDGSYGGDLWLSQRKLAEDIYRSLNSGSFAPYRSKFLNFTITVGNTGYAGNMPCFRYKIAYPEKWTHIYDTAYISVFFTLRDVELRLLVGDANPYDESVFAAAERCMERSEVRELDNLRAASDWVSLGGSQVRLFRDLELRNLDRLALRSHAEELYRLIGHAQIGMPIPTREDELYNWITHVQRGHLEPLSVGYDRFGNRVSKSVAYDALGDRITSKTATDALGDRTTTKTFTDPYGDKVTTKTSTDIFGDKKVTRTDRDIFGNVSKSSTFTDPYGDKFTTKTATDIFGDRKTTRTARDAWGDVSRSTTLTDAYGDRFTKSSFGDPYSGLRTTSGYSAVDPIGARLNRMTSGLRGRLYR